MYGESTSARVMKCGGHIGRARGHALNDRKSKKSFTTDFQKKHKEKFPIVESVSCCCKGKCHSAGRRCITDAFLSLPNKACFVL